MTAITIEQFKRRRQKLLGSLPENAAAIIPSNTEVSRNSDVHYPFRQDSDFFYLTGFNEPDALLLLLSQGDTDQSILFCRERHPEKELWDGPRAGTEGAVQTFAVDAAYPIEHLDEKMPTLLEGSDMLYFSFGKKAALDTSLNSWLATIVKQKRAGKKAPSALMNLDNLLHEHRLIKSPEEIELMQKAASISAKAHCLAMQQAAPGVYEYQLEATILQEFHRQGARQAAYSSIVGSGSNACILHYIDNDRMLEAGELVLIDAGCDLQCYAADITRTFPVSGKFNEAQKAIYQLVLDAQLAAIDNIKPGTPWNRPHDVTVKVISEGLIQLGLLKGTPEQIIESGDYRAFYMHRAGHFLGMDVHDVGDYQKNGQWRNLEPGMVLTVEPGIYIAKNNTNVDPQWRGIGVRIEDDVVVTASSCQVLTHEVPKSIQAIEALMASS